MRESSVSPLKGIIVGGFIKEVLKTLMGSVILLGAVVGGLIYWQSLANRGELSSIFIIMVWSVIFVCSVAACKLLYKSGSEFISLRRFMMSADIELKNGQRQLSTEEALQRLAKEDINYMDHQVILTDHHFIILKYDPTIYPLKSLHYAYQEGDHEGKPATKAQQRLIYLKFKQAEKMVYAPRTFEATNLLDALEALNKPVKIKFSSEAVAMQQSNQT